MSKFIRKFAIILLVTVVFTMCIVFILHQVVNSNGILAADESKPTISPIFKVEPTTPAPKANNGTSENLSYNDLSYTANNATSSEPTTSPVPTTSDNGYVYYDIPLDREVQEYVQDICKEYDFTEYLNVIYGLIGLESNYSMSAVSSTSDYGYMQINITNASWLKDAIGVTDFVNDWRQNIKSGIYILKSMYTYMDDDINYALIAYNAGPNMAAQYRSLGVENNNYSYSVLDNAEKLEIIS